MSVLCLVSLSKIIFEMMKKIRVGMLTWVKYLQLFLLKLTRLNWSREVIAIQAGIIPISVSC